MHGFQRRRAPRCRKVSESTGMVDSLDKASSFTGVANVFEVDYLELKRMGKRLDSRLH